MGNIWSSLPAWPRLGRRSVPADPVSERWRETLRAAAAVPYYARWKKELSRAAHAGTDEERRAALLRLPEVELDYFFSHFRLFRGKELAALLLRETRPLWPVESRVAAIAPWFHIGSSSRLFLTPDAAEIQKFSPEVIAAPIDVLETLGASDEWPQESSLFALAALCGVGTPILTMAARERLWRAFGVPVYLQLRGFQGELLARECEAHDGLHFNPWDVIVECRPSGELLLTSLANPRHTVLRLAVRLHAWIDMRPCGCGLTTPRLMHLQPASAHTVTYRAPSDTSLTALAGAVKEAAPVEEPQSASP